MKCISVVISGTPALVFPDCEQEYLFRKYVMDSGGLAVRASEETPDTPKTLEMSVGHDFWGMVLFPDSYRPPLLDKSYYLYDCYTLTEEEVSSICGGMVNAPEIDSEDKTGISNIMRRWEEEVEWNSDLDFNMELLMDDPEAWELSSGKKFPGMCPECQSLHLKHSCKPRMVTRRFIEGITVFTHLGVMLKEVCLDCGYKSSTLVKWDIPIEDTMLIPEKHNGLKIVRDLIQIGAWITWIALFADTLVTHNYTAPRFIVLSLLAAFNVGFAVVRSIRKSKSRSNDTNEKH